MSFNPMRAAQAVAEAHRARARFENLAGDLAPPSITDAYAVQNALRQVWSEDKGSVTGRKIATTTKVMQDLMGIDHPCGGLIYAKTVHPTGVALDPTKFINLRIECELAVLLAADLPGRADGSDYGRDDVRAAVGEVMAAFELIEDRGADYAETDARSLIADNAWNGGIVLGPDVAVRHDRELNGLRGAANLNGNPHGEGLTDDPMGALAWVANLAVQGGDPLRRGMTVITGSVIPTFSVSPGDRVDFEIDGIGQVALAITT